MTVTPGNFRIFIWWVAVGKPGRCMGPHMRAGHPYYYRGRAGRPAPGGAGAGLRAPRRVLAGVPPRSSRAHWAHGGRASAIARHARGGGPRYWHVLINVLLMYALHKNIYFNMAGGQGHVRMCRGPRAGASTRASLRGAGKQRSAGFNPSEPAAQNSGGGASDSGWAAGSLRRRTVAGERARRHTAAEPSEL